MAKDNIVALHPPELGDLLQQVLREGACKLLAATIESEVKAFLEQHKDLKTDDGMIAVVRNGYLVGPEKQLNP